MEPTEFWEQRYGERAQIWSGRPNQALVDTVGDDGVLVGVTPGHALDLGSGEGGDAIWLAERGWHVTAVDISTTATNRAIAAADARGICRGPGLGEITWTIADLAGWHPSGSYDLVVACFLHSPVALPRRAVVQRVAAAIVPGGHLLVVGHEAPPPWATLHDHADHDFRTAQEDLADLELDPGQWTTVVCESRHREAIGPDGEPAKLDDAVIVLRRR